MGVSLRKAMAQAYAITDGVKCTDAGVADAVALTSASPGSKINAWVDGMTFWFIAAETNTGATTLTRDGLTAVDVVTITGSVLPAGYLRTDAPTHCRYDAATGRIIADREIERGENANGEYVKFADGTQFCSQRNLNQNIDTDSASTSIYVSDSLPTAPYPSGFSSLRYASIGTDSPGAGQRKWIVSDDQGGHSNSEWGSFRVADNSSDTANGVNIEKFATGLWYNFDDPDA